MHTFIPEKNAVFFNYLLLFPFQPAKNASSQLIQPTLGEHHANAMLLTEVREELIAICTLQ